MCLGVSEQKPRGRVQSRLRNLVKTSWKESVTKQQLRQLVIQLGPFFNLLTNNKKASTLLAGDDCESVDQMVAEQLLILNL